MATLTITKSNVIDVAKTKLPTKMKSTCGNPGTAKVGISNCGKTKKVKPIKVMIKP